MERGAAFIQLEPTTRCNFTCGFCCGRHMPQEDLDWDVFQATLDAFPEVEHVELQGEGESLLHQRFFDMVRALRERDVKVSFITNGSLLSPTKVDQLLELGVDKISVSIESPDPKDFREIRGGKLEKVLRNLRHLMAERHRRGLRLPVVGLSVTVLRRTKHQVDDVFALYRDLGLDGGISLQSLQKMDSYASHYDDAMDAQHLSDREASKYWLSPFGDMRVRRIQRERSDAALGFYDELMEGWAPAKGNCPYLDQGLYVNLSGEATPCCMVKDGSAHGLGKVGVDSRESILARREALRQELASGSIPAPCEGCEIARHAVMGPLQLMGVGVRGMMQRVFG